MARGVYKITPPQQDRTDASLGTPTPLAPGLGFLVDGVIVHQLAGAENEMILMPKSYESRQDVGDDAAWRTDDDGDAHKCWQSRIVYQQIEHHPRLLRFVRPDPWTWLPVVAKPGGPPLRDFLRANHHEMYEERANPDRSTASGRVRASRRHLVYQWALHLASALQFIHSHSFELPAPKIEIVFGDLSVDSCWLTSSTLSLSVLGFLKSGFRTRSGPLHLGDISDSEAFQPLRGVRGPARRPTLQTDLFLWGCVVYELMTGHWPGNGQGLSWQEMSSVISTRKWPRLETDCLGDVVHMCWAEEITSAAKLLATARRSITDLGAAISDSDEVVDLNMKGLTI